MADAKQDVYNQKSAVADDDCVVVDAMRTAAAARELARTRGFHY